MKFVEKADEADVIIAGFPVDQGTENKGCADAPSKIREMFGNFYFSESSHEKNVFDASDAVEEDSFEKTMSAISKKIENLLKYKKLIVSIGGNHAISSPIIYTFSQNYPDLGVLFIDAHPDCQENYLPHGDIITGLVKQKIPVVIIGIRNWSKAEQEFLLKNKILFLQAKDFTLEKAKELVRKHLSGKKIYISLDIDAIDPGFAPGTGCIEPMGLNPREVLELILSVENPVGLDVVEVCPEKDLNDMTSALTAKIIMEFIDRN